MFSSFRAGAARLVSPGFTLPRDALAWVYATALLLETFDLFAHTDKPVKYVTVAFLLLALYARATAYLPAALLLLFLFVLPPYYPEWVWTVPAASFFVPFLLCTLVCAPFTDLRRRFHWLRKGRTDQLTWALVALTSLVSALALILWALWTDYLGVATQMLAPLKTAPRLLSLLVLVPGFALVNAAAEELVYRGVIQDALEEGWSLAPGVLLILQASAFAAAHYHGGFPNGKMGYAMVFIYALMLGGLRRRTEGMLAPYAAHVAADAVIGATLVLLVS